MIYLGFDTSNYTTSVASVCNASYNNIRSVLPVKEGERGIRQSEGVFLHIKNIGTLFERLDDDFTEVGAVGVSTRPRSVDGSYMPVFLAGEAFARGIAHSLGVPLYTFSHQEGHIMAGILSAGADELTDGDFISVHLSGGTTEILKTRYFGASFTNEIIGGTKDISAGQFIDRTGVYLGMKFPCGKELDQLANSASEADIKGTLKLPVWEKDGYVSFSGVETKIKNMIGSAPKELLARAVLENISEVLVRAINSCLEKTNLSRVLVVGGVASNSILRQRFCEKIRGQIYFASPELSTDNAVGIAKLAQLKHDFKKSMIKE